jgi:hypothetical protein
MYSVVFTSSKVRLWQVKIYLGNFKLRLWGTWLFLCISFLDDDSEVNITDSVLIKKTGLSYCTEDNYGAVITANHEALAQILDQVRIIGFSRVQ